ncbi:MAG: hypothetical protein NZZ60_04440 [Bacteroidia bacterium]|nr:hypothetical protein [Bacteroidia bacterium]MCX7651379.1 hypothetical protein [Bacteroidia bacterium]MDW8416721.1 hypothetical protein [Bacteroidia bacterium]
MPYSPEEYERLKEFYKNDLRERKAFIEELRRRRLRQKAEWELQQMEASLRRLGVDDQVDPLPPADTQQKSDSFPENKTLL